MPTIKPTDHSSEDGEWWKSNKTSREHNDVDPDYDRHIDDAEMRKNQFEESELPVEYPSSG